MKRVVIIGGGFAGLSAAVHLAQSGHEITLLERRRNLGGRAFSFTDPKTGDTVDNGQHLFMKCYRATCDLLKRIGTRDRLFFQQKFQLDFLSASSEPARLAFSSRIPAPLHLLFGFLRFRPLNLADTFRLRHMQTGLRAELPLDLSVETWLRQRHQSARICSAFWYPLCIAALNEPPQRASARHLQAVLREAFFGPPDGALMGYAQVGLSGLISTPATAFLQAHGVTVKHGTTIRRICLPEEPAAFSLALRSGAPIPCDACITALPPNALHRILPHACTTLKQRLERFQSSPILSVNLWFDRPILDQPFVGLIGTRMEWVFNKSALYAGGDRASTGHVTLVASAARDLVARPEREIVDLAISELNACVPNAQPATLLHARVVCEHNATFSLPLGCEPPDVHSGIPGLFLAGDWTQTGLPGTIESAVRSGEIAARAVRNFLQK